MEITVKKKIKKLIQEHLDNIFVVYIAQSTSI